MIHTLISGIKHYLYSVDDHSLHSPLVYEFYNSVIKSPTREDAEIEKIRKDLLKSKEIIKVTDYGAGSSRGTNRKLSEIAKIALSKTWKSSIILKTAEFFDCKRIVEFGTSLGINSLYISSIEGSELTTFEGDPKIADIAQSNFDTMGRNNIRLIKGPLEETLINNNHLTGKYDLFFLDANHQYAPTIKYYQKIQSHLHDQSIVIFDDIHYSEEMDRAWSSIKAEVPVRISLDLFRLGILIYQPELSKKDYILST